MLHFMLLLLIGLVVSGCDAQRHGERYQPTGALVSVQVYKVGIHPYLNSKKMFRSYRPILDYLETQLEDAEFVLETSADYAAYEKKLYGGAFHVSLPNPFQTYNAISKQYRVIAKMKPDAVFRGIIVARKDRHLKNVAELKGKVLSFPAPTALAATMMPLYYLYQQGLDVNSDIEKRYVGSQYSSILNAYTADTAAAATWPPPWESWCKENPDKAAQMEVLWQTNPLVNNGVVVRHDVSDAVAADVAQVLVGLSEVPQGKVLLERAGFEGFEAADNATYDVVADFMKAYEHAIGVPK